MSEAQERVTLHHEKGLHARPGSIFVQTASNFEAEISVSKIGDDETVDGKSSIDILSLGAEQGDEITIRANNGQDSNEAVQTLVSLVEHDFEEPTQ